MRYPHTKAATVFVLLVLAILVGLTSCTSSLEAVETETARAGEEYAALLEGLDESATQADWLCERFGELEKEATEAADSTETLTPHYYNLYSPMREHACELSRLLEELPITRRGL